MKIVAIIPARYSSTRLPGKPLKDICGHPMIWWVYKNITNIKEFSDVFVATDDSRIYDYCTGADINCIMTKEHKYSVERIQEVSERIPADLYVQINGDEPLIDENVVKKIIPNNFDPKLEIAFNIITKIKNDNELMDPSNIKMVFDNSYKCKYMSRNVIPYSFKGVKHDYYKHVGIIAYTKPILDFYKGSKIGYLESIEAIDSLRFIDYDKSFILIPVDNCNTLSVDTEKDLEIVKQYILQNKII